MKESEITLADLFRLSNYLPPEWDFAVQMTRDGADFMLIDPEGFDCIVEPGETPDRMILNHINEARRAEKMKPINWAGEEQDA